MESLVGRAIYILDKYVGKIKRNEERARICQQQGGELAAFTHPGH